MEPTPTTDETNSAKDRPVIFRPKKKKATFRRKHDGSASAFDTPSPAAIEGAPATIPAAEEEDDGPSVAELLRQRRKQQRLKGASSNSGRPRGDPNDEEIQEQALVRAEAALDSIDTGLGAIPKRFAAQTGLVGELVNRHM